jgi:hypothetical protein
VSSSIYLIRPEWHGDLEDTEDYVVDALLHGPRYIRVALELWRLADHEERAVKIKAILERGCERSGRILYTEDIKEFYELLVGLELELKKSVVNSDWEIPPDRIAEVRRRTTLLDIEESRGVLARWAVWEAMSEVYGLRDFLKQALDRNLHVALG